MIMNTVEAALVTKGMSKPCWPLYLKKMECWSMRLKNVVYVKKSGPIHLAI